MKKKTPHYAHPLVNPGFDSDRPPQTERIQQEGSRVSCGNYKKKPQEHAAAFPSAAVEALEHLTKDNYKVADNYGSSHCAIVRPLNWLRNPFEAKSVLKSSFLSR